MQCGQEFSFSDLKSKIVINVLDGKILGNIIDIIFFPGSGKILGFVVPGEKKGWFRSCENLFIPYNCVCKVGIDCILVRLCELQKLSPNKKEIGGLIGILDNQNQTNINRNQNFDAQNQNFVAQKNENFSNENLNYNYQNNSKNQTDEYQKNYYEFYQNQQNLGPNFQNNLDY